MRIHCLVPLLIASATLQGAFGADAADLWSRKVQPLFDVQCVKCHGPIEQKSGLELDTVPAALKGGDEGAVLVPGKPEQSRLFAYLAPESDPHMPPKKQLTDEERELVRQWIVALGEAPTRPETPPVEPARVFASTTGAIDFYLAAGWRKREIQPAPAADDRVWCRRAYLDLAGRIPTRSELTDFAGCTDADKRARLIDRLLDSDEYAVHMRELWDVFLMGRVKRDSHEDRRKNNGWWSFLEHRFRENRPWNETVREILVARPEKEEDKGAFWFLYERRDEHQAIAEAVAPVVYGTKINCAQCHDHPLAREIKQAHYWGLVAAFNRSKNVRDEGVGESAIGGFINFTNLKKESQPAVVTLLNGKTLPESWPASGQKEEDADDKYVDPKAKVRVPRFSRREAFADAATIDNPLLARAFVNRMWAVLLGRGLIHPADEMNARNAPSHPALLDWLAEDFAKNGYDVKRLVRGLILTQAYALTHAARPPESFASALERPLTAEQLARSWRIAAGGPKDDDALRRATVGAIPDVLPKEYNASFQQAQFLEDSPEFAALLKPGSGNTAQRLLDLTDNSERARMAFQSALQREPDTQETAAAVDFLKERAEDVPGAVRDLLWALMTSAEFLTMP